MTKESVALYLVFTDKRYALRLAQALTVIWREFSVHVEEDYSFLKIQDREDKAGLEGVILTDWATLHAVGGKIHESYITAKKPPKKKMPLFIIGKPLESFRPRASGTETERSETAISYIPPYTTAREIGAAILSGIGFRRRTTIERDDAVILVASARGGVGVSAVAACLSKELRSLQGGSVICWPMDPFPAPERYFPGRDSAPGFEDFALDFVQKKGNCFPEKYYRTDEEGVLFFSYGSRFNSFYELPEDEKTRLMNSVFDSVEKGFVIMDVSSMNPYTLGMVLENVSLLVLVEDETAGCMEANRNLEKMLLWRYSFDGVLHVRNHPAYTSDGGPTGFVQGREREQREGEIRESGERIGDRMSIPYDPDSFENPGMIPEYLFRSEVRKIAAWVLETRRANTPGP